MSLTIFYRYRNQNEKVFTSSASEILIGRTKDIPVDLELSPDLKVSRPHAKFFYELGTWWVRDVNSQRGTILNGKRVSEPTELFPGDEVQVGDTILRVEFDKADIELGAGTLESFHVQETQPPSSIPEDRSLKVLTSISTIVAHSKGAQAMLEGFLHELSNAFPQAERKSILLIEDGELVTRVYWPPERAFVSFTLARQAIKKREALHWKQQSVTNDNQLVPSLQDTVEALYAPMISNGNVVGVIHMDTTKGVSTFSESDWQLLSVIANTVGPALKATGGLVQIPSVFISYSHQDRTFTNRLTSDLRRRGIKVYMDERLQVGEGWRKQLAVAIENTDAFVLIMSPPSVASDYVAWELETALTLRKKIFPLMHRESDVPQTILPLQYINIRQDYEKGLDELADGLRGSVRPGALPGA
jgi:hypothetical protein